MIVTTKEFFVPGVPLFNCYDQSSLPDSSQRDIRAMVEVMGFPVNFKIKMSKTLIVNHDILKLNEMLHPKIL